MRAKDAHATIAESSDAISLARLVLPEPSAMVMRKDCAVRLRAGTCHSSVVYEPNWVP
jgi:hypothetical protein